MNDTIKAVIVEGAMLQIKQEIKEAFTTIKKVVDKSRDNEPSEAELDTIFSALALGIVGISLFVAEAVKASQSED